MKIHCKSENNTLGFIGIWKDTIKNFFFLPVFLKSWGDREIKISGRQKIKILATSLLGRGFDDGKREIHWHMPLQLCKVFFFFLPFPSWVQVKTTQKLEVTSSSQNCWSPHLHACFCDFKGNSKCELLCARFQKEGQERRLLCLPGFLFQTHQLDKSTPPGELPLTLDWCLEQRTVFTQESFNTFSLRIYFFPNCRL